MSVRPLTLGGMVYGQTFLDIFERFCVASLRAPANLEALRDNSASLALYTDRESSERLRAILGDLLPYDLYELTPNPNEWLYETLAAAHALLVRRAAANDRAFHMLMPDQCYSERYFPNLFRLAEQGDVVHNGLNVDMAGASGIAMWTDIVHGLVTDECRLAIPAVALGAIAWRNLHERMSAYLMNRVQVPGPMPLAHFHLWRARDRVLLFSPHNNPMYMTPETLRRYPEHPAGTLDTQAQWMLRDFVCPTLEDDMVAVGIEHGPGPAYRPPVEWSTFAANCWREIGGHFPRLQYYRKPIAEIPAAIMEGMPTAADVLQRQRVIADGLEEWGIVGAAA
jgi:hypothetical protein